MIQFYAPEIEEAGALPESESGHCCRVLRKKEGDEILVTDGRGNRFKAVITDASPKKTLLEIVGREHIGSHWGARFVLAVAPTKNADRMEWLAEKAVEMGVDEIVLLRCAHSERKVMKTERLGKIVVSAMNQSLKTNLPLLRGPVAFDEFIGENKGSDRFMGYCSDEVERKILSRECKAGKDTVVLIGPEGDFSPEEVKKAMEAGFIPVSFGESRLRTETAALFALQTLHTIAQLNLTQ